MLHASALAVGWRSALLALLPKRRREFLYADVATPETSRLSAESYDEREPFHLDDTEIAVRLVKSAAT